MGRSMSDPIKDSVSRDSVSRDSVNDPTGGPMSDPITDSIDLMLKHLEEISKSESQGLEDIEARRAFASLALKSVSTLRELKYVYLMGRGTSDLEGCRGGSVKLGHVLRCACCGRKPDPASGVILHKYSACTDADEREEPDMETALKQLEIAQRALEGISKLGIAALGEMDACK